jgi:hypothetical protein
MQKETATSHIVMVSRDPGAPGERETCPAVRKQNRARGTANPARGSDKTLNDPR